ncbi:MAG: HAMP domain-containing histidine kinase [Pyrinomonadaceae bacterium]|nr:HAMP domain-containing histidine kinase [Pyrinomonadaceae bacterium]
MRVVSRRKAAIFSLVLGICLIILTIALNVGWILLNLQEIALLVLGIVFFAIIITGLTLNTIFLVREIRRNEQHDAFLNAVTHELKTPIASIRLYLETLQTREVSEEKRREFYGVMLADNDRLLNTVEQVLQASRTREKNHLLNIAEINLTKLLEKSVERVKVSYGLGDDAIGFNQTDADFRVSGDANELQTVFTNLLENAVKYSEDEIKISLAVRNLNEKYVIVRIKDSGIGIAPTELKRIFKRFYRVPGLTTQKRKGTGLGLFIVRSIVKKHGGKIFAESKGEGTGTTFIVQLPKLSQNRKRQRPGLSEGIRDEG